MKERLFIDGYEIESKYILSVSNKELSFKFAGNRLISSKAKVELANGDYRFDDRQNTNGFFKDYDWYNAITVIYDKDLSEILWEGRIKKIDLSDKDKSITLEIHDYIQDMIDTNCVISRSGVTVSEAIYAILTDPDYLNIPSNRIIESDFFLASSIQSGQLIDINFEKENGQKCISVIEELVRISNSHIYIKNNKIGYWVWRKYGGETGIALQKRDLIEDSYSHSTSADEIINQYYIAYKNSASVLFTEGSNFASVDKYNAGKIFVVPPAEVKSTSSIDFKILYNTKSSADKVGQSIIERYGNLKRKCTFSIKDHVHDIQLGDQVDLRFHPYTREPGIITSLKPNREDNTVDLEVELTNYPPTVDIDIIPPAPVELLDVFTIDQDQTWLKWTKSPEADHLGYRVYYTTTLGQWGNEISAKNIGWVEIKHPLEFQGNCIYVIEGLQPDTLYYFKIISFDQSFNLSDDSNILSHISANMPASTQIFYMCKGHMFYGITLDINNSEGGYIPNGFTHYDELNYHDDDSVFQTTYENTAVYQSYLLKRSKGIDKIITYGTGQLGNIVAQWRSYTNSSYSAWSDEIPAIGTVAINTEGNIYVQLRFIFKSPFWADSEKILITDIVEVE
jgi:hypothetical protein